MRVRNCVYKTEGLRGLRLANDPSAKGVVEGANQKQALDIITIPYSKPLPPTHPGASFFSEKKNKK